MADHGYASRTSSTSAKAASGSAAAAPKDANMTNAEHTTFVDLLLQQAAAAARDARMQAEPKALAQGVNRAVTRARQALSEYLTPGTSTVPTRIFTALDATFMGLFDLHAVLVETDEGDASPHADDLRDVMLELKQRFEPLGWKSPTSVQAGHARQTKAAARGAAELTTSEKGKLGLLHIRAARQHILGGWHNVIDNNVSAVAEPAAGNLRDAMSLLIDPSLASEMKSVAIELEMTKAVLNRLFLYVSKYKAAALPSLRQLAKSADALLELVGMRSSWTEKVAIPAQQPSGKDGPEPLASPASTPAASPAATMTNSNDIDPGPPRADPAMHRIEESRVFTKKVHIKDTNYVNEYLGYIELFMIVNRTPSGQLYVQAAQANNYLHGRGNAKLSIGAGVTSFSLRKGSDEFTDIFFDVVIGGPHTTTTRGVEAGMKASVGGGQKGGAGGEASIGISHSVATTSQASRSFRRVFRVSRLKNLQPIFEFDQATSSLKQTETGMTFSEREELRHDFSGFELDDDDVGDDWDTFYANWVLHSYSD